MHLFGKGAKTRVDETVAFIADKVPVAERQAVKEYLNYLIGWYVPDQKEFKNFSRRMTMTDAEDPGDKTDRAARRALIMLDSVRTAPA